MGGRGGYFQSHPHTTKKTRRVETKAWDVRQMDACITNSSSRPATNAYTPRDSRLKRL